MDPSLTHPRRHIVDGTIRVFLAEALILPTGLVTVIFLTRRLGPEGYGLFTLAAVLMNWIGWTIPSLLSRASIKFVSEAPDWRSVGTIVLRLYLTLSCVAALLLFFLAGPASGLLNEPSLTACLRLFAIEIPLFSLAVAHRNILTGIGKFRQRALTSAGRWSSRLILIVLLVEMGFSVHGAILGSIGAALVEMVIGRFYVRPSLFHRSSFPARRLFSYAVPLSFFALTMQLFTKLDLIMLKLLGGTTEQAGFYGAAQNLSIVPGIFALSFSPLLLSTLSQMLGAGEGHSARDLGRDAMRTVTWLLPFAGMTAGASVEIVALVFGPQYISAAPLLALLIFSALAWVMISVATTILTATGKPTWPFAVTWPMLPLAFIGHMLLIPRLGPVGASLTTTVLTILGAMATVLAVYRIWRVAPPPATFMRSIMICAVAFALATLWPAPGFLLLVKLLAIALVIPLAFLLTGELKTDELAFLRSILNLRKKTEKTRM